MLKSAPKSYVQHTSQNDTSTMNLKTLFIIMLKSALKSYFEHTSQNDIKTLKWVDAKVVRQPENRAKKTWIQHWNVANMIKTADLKLQ